LSLLVSTTRQRWALPPTTPEPNNVFGQKLWLGALLSLPKVLSFALQLDPMLLGLVTKLGLKHFQQVNIVLGPAVVPEGGCSSIVFFY
jgi:hypothetical protein